MPPIIKRPKMPQTDPEWDALSDEDLGRLPYCQRGNSEKIARAERKRIKEKIAYVKSQSQTREHHCHWPGCKKQVPPAMWGCYTHWRMLPKLLRDKIWATFRPGQEVTMTPSKEYLEAADEVQQWIRSRYPGIV